MSQNVLGLGAQRVLASDQLRLLTTALLLALACSQDVVPSPLAMMQDSQRFHQQVQTSRWQSNPMDYIDGVSSNVLQHPYTVAHDLDDDSFFVASFTLNHVVRLRMSGRTSAQYKVFVSGSELDGPVGMVVDGGVLFVASFTNDHVLRVNTSDGALLGRIGDEDSLDCPEGIALGPVDGRLYVTSFLLSHLSVFEPGSGRHLGSFGALPPATAAPRQPKLCVATCLLGRPLTELTRPRNSLGHDTHSALASYAGTARRTWPSTCAATCTSPPTTATLSTSSRARRASCWRATAAAWCAALSASPATFSTAATCSSPRALPHTVTSTAPAEATH